MGFSAYSRELTAAMYDNEKLGLGIATFQGLSNIAINGKYHLYCTYTHLLIVCCLLGMVLAVVSHGGALLASNQITAGQLMAFLVATQTIQKYAH